MMKIKTLKQRSIVALVAACMVLGALLTACGKAPTLGTEVKDYDQFKRLGESSLELKTGKKLQVFIPKDGSKSASGNHLSASANGTSLNLRSVDAAYVNSAGGTKAYLQKYGSMAAPNLNAAVDTLGKIKKTEDGNTYYRTGFQVLPQYGNGYYSVCRTEFLTKIVGKDKETTNYVMGMINIANNAANDKTQATVDEMSQYYQVKVYWNSKKAKKAAKKYTQNPPTTKRVLSGSYTVPIPSDWRMDTTRTTSNVTFYGPGGSASAAQNLLIARRYISSSTQNFSDAAFKQYFERAMQKAFNGMQVEMNAVKSPIASGKAYSLKMSRGNAQINGYLFFGKYNVIMIYNVSEGNISADQKTVLDNAFNGLVAYSDLKDDKNN
ncbi:hypothetical protein HMP0721_1074 [Pseudoramibacter alactolyticus ATCC 23263]|uniref:Uncharacterized protein n=1 Tax=Pseudoramibacter alactolyticus ATCC 23263 TaxID=887929 RepID=E6MGE1_9FIRM|nr:hypothetical protein [Pseudoramibacter alactolyticus]EFV01681.1 hypothetical protein HMP0721_1074 [Pseudoramibacter alactolyticus ATCC 23263]